MEDVVGFDGFDRCPEALDPKPPPFNRDEVESLDKGDQDSSLEGGDDGGLIDSVLCDPGSRLIRGGFTKPASPEEYVMFLNAGGEASNQVDSFMKFHDDAFYEGGDALRTNEIIVDSGDYPFVYQSARFGNFSYRIDSFHPGDYFVDLHFVEIIFTNGPKGMRVFNVFMQEEKVLSDFDIFRVVGANKALQLVDFRVSVKEDGIIAIKFEGVNGSPLVSGICIRKAPEVLGTRGTGECIKCNNCCTEIEIPLEQKKIMQTKLTAKFERQIKDLSVQNNRKTDECYQAWMSLTTANEQLEKFKMELDIRTFEKRSLDQVVEKQDENLRNLSSKYAHDKQFWALAVHDLDKKIKIMKREHSQLSREAHECADSIPELNSMVSGVQALVAQCEDLKMKYSEEQTKRRKLYNQLQETKGNIRVFCRCRPLSKEEVSAGCATIVDFDAAKDGDLGILTGGATRKTFKFDKVYTPKDDQVDVFADASPLVLSVLDGYNVCIFAYGQTGTGKTFTMEGTEQNRGVNYRTLEQLFRTAEERSDTFVYNISVSVLEVYNEQIRDLLATAPTSKKLEIKQASEGFHNVPGIVEAKVESTKEVWNVLQTGSSARAVGSNNVNEHSSRSHCMLCIMVRSKNLISGECTRSKLWLVDLAGSERLAKTDAQGERLKEAQNINKSLSALGDVISALANKSSHIPYRNSKLTHLLQDSLGGDSKTLMFVQISPSDKDSGETLSSLNFATRVRGIELGPAKKQIDPNELQKMKATLDKARQESRSKDESLRKLEENLQSLENKTRSKDQTYKVQQERIKELEDQLQLKASLQNQSEKQVLQLSDKLKGREETFCVLQQKVKELETKLREREQSEFAILQQKVKNLESKLKEQMQESEHHALMFQEKIIELQRKLKEREDNSESLVLHQKIKELEEKLRQKEQEMQGKLTQDYADGIRATPIIGKTGLNDGNLGEIEARILRSTNSVNRPVSQGSVFSGGYESLYDRTRKRNSRSGETENFLPNASSDKRGRKSDPPKVAKVTRPVKLATNAQGPFTSTSRRFSRDQVQGPKEKDNKKKIWSR
ncbi:kinesin-like protein KIN-14R isoform X2 [Syzygium oleosum]|uniref:kinesin-like protein KIN-14R isoform X2 n=1 Tax=Syzygium oleosum TaxID=219896 RepID=UPI0024B8C1E7|nr:kinesin-like protein KIN-14R isoform X2 [Syzygium oleosum]